MSILSYDTRMFKPLAVYIGLRYTRAKRRNHFVSFISLASVIGIALGVAVLITVLSVMNGFDYEIHGRVFSLARQVTVSSRLGAVQDWRQVEKEVLQQKNVVAAAPFVSGQGMLTNAGLVHGVMINGIIPDEEAKISLLPSTVVKGSMNKLVPGAFGIVLGQEIALHLGVSVGDKVVLVMPQATLTPMGIVPRFKRFDVVGIFRVGEGFGYDSTTAFINLSDAQKLFQYKNGVTGLNLKINELYAAPQISAELNKILPEEYYVSDWTNEFGTYFKAVRMEKTMMFLLLMFIIAVAAFNLVSSLYMTVTDKQADIAILRTLGASPKTIMSIFIVQGAVIGGIGTLIGVVGGILLAINVPTIVKFLEYVFHTSFISAAIYFINYLPSKLEVFDVVRVGVIAFVMSLLATIYPAWRAAKTEPAEALRYE